jgi:hypothetical protein
MPKDCRCGSFPCNRLYPLRTCVGLDPLAFPTSWTCKERLGKSRHFGVECSSDSGRMMRLVCRVARAESYPKLTA